MCREHELDRQLEQRAAQRFEDLLARLALAQPVDRELEAVAAVDERVADDERPVALDPEHEVVVQHAREYLEPHRQPVAGREHVPLLLEALEIIAQPRDVVVEVVRLRHEHRCAESLHEAAGVALVPGVRQNDDRFAVGRELFELPWRGHRIDQQQPLAVVDRVGRDIRSPALRVRRRPVRMRRLPVPQARLQLAHGGMLNARAR